MSHPSVLGLTAPAPAAPAVSIGMVARRVGRAIWNALEESGRRRAEPELARFAAAHADRYPELAARYAKPYKTSAVVSAST